LNRSAEEVSKYKKSIKVFHFLANVIYKLYPITSVQFNKYIKMNFSKELNYLSHHSPLD